jgi:hypothetical protein
MAHRVIARQRNNSVAFEAKRTFSTPRLQYRIYQYAAYRDSLYLCYFSLVSFY